MRLRGNAGGSKWTRDCANARAGWELAGRFSGKIALRHVFGSSNPPLSQGPAQKCRIINRWRQLRAMSFC